MLVHFNGWRPGFCGPHQPLLLSPPRRRLLVHAGGMLVSSDGSSLCGHVAMAAQQRLAEKEPQSASMCGSQRKDEPTELHHSRHWSPSLSPGAQLERSNIPLLYQMGDPSSLQRECPGSVLWNHWCLNYVVLKPLHGFKSEENDTQWSQDICPRSELN